MRHTLEERFWAKVQKEPDCWLWIGAKYRDGYGNFLVNPTRAAHTSGRSHRVAWEIASGAPIPIGGVIGHTCDTPLCVRNDEQGTYIVNGRQLPRFGHLFLGTAGDNTLDMVAKGRSLHLKGEQAGQSRLTALEVAEIRRQYGAGRLQRDIAADFGVTQSNVGYIVRNKTWR